jgi:hypothetical protein
MKGNVEIYIARMIHGILSNTFVICRVYLLIGGEFPIVWTLFNKLGRIYGKKINESAKKSPCFLTRKSGSLGVVISSRNIQR